MEKLEIKKSLERTKSLIIFSMVVLFLLIPSFLLKFSDKKEIVILTLTAFTIVILYKRIRRLNQKLNSLTK